MSFKFRPDVATIIAFAIMNAPEPPDFAYYDKVKRKLSFACGWDAGERYDQRQFDRAMAEFTKRVRT